jgi:hypothetical protein
MISGLLLLRQVNAGHENLESLGLANCVAAKSHCIENMFGRHKDRRCIAIGYNRCAHTYFSAITPAAVTFWLRPLGLTIIIGWKGPSRPALRQLDGFLVRAAALAMQEIACKSC